MVWKVKEGREGPRELIASFPDFPLKLSVLSPAA